MKHSKVETETGNAEIAPARKTTAQRLGVCVRSALPAAMRTALWLIRISIPISFLVLILKLTGGLNLIARVFEPVFAVLGLPGEASVVFVTSCLVNIYSCIAVIETLDLSGRAVTILALMCLISHSLPVECAVQRRTGSSVGRMLLVRLGCSVVGAILLNLILPGESLRVSLSRPPVMLTLQLVRTEMLQWLVGMLYLCTKILVLVTLLTIVERVLHEFGVTRLLARGMRIPLKLLGLPHETAFLWIVANVLGLGYGAGVIVDTVERGDLSREHADTLNHHIAVSHSLLEDTCLFVAIGVSAWWITLPRIVLAAGVVWLKRLLETVGFQSPARVRR